MSTTVHRQCTLCEAHCGIKVEVEGSKVLRITGDPEHHLSRGYICPKAAALTDLYEDPDRLRAPVRKRADGSWEQIGWDEAIEYAASGLRAVAERHGRHAVANYLGNPGAHTWSVLAFLNLRLALWTRNSYSASSTDQLPQHVVATEVWGNPVSIPIPDPDRTMHMLIIGANPAVSNGSVMTAPGMRDRLRDIRRRGGKVVVIDPRRTETVKLADEHVQVRPGGDPYLLLAMLHVLFAEDRVDLGALAAHADGLDEVRRLVAPWTPERAAEHCGIDADTIARTAREFADAPNAVAYGRVGVCQQTTGTITHWLITLLNAVSGNVDREGGLMFTTPAVDLSGLFKLLRRLDKPLHRNRTARVSGLPDTLTEFPVAGLADEIITPGQDQVRGLVVFAGNPVLSSPGGGRLDAALEELEFMVAVDSFVTETTRHADVILPGISPLERDDLDLVLSGFGIRNHLAYNRRAVEPAPGQRNDWEILNDLAARVGTGLGGRLASAYFGIANRLGVTKPSTVAEIAIFSGPHGLLRRGLRNGVTVGRLKRSEHGIDLGALQPRLPGILTTRSGRAQLAPQLFLDEARKLDASATDHEAATRDGFDLTLIGRRSLRSNNSWMHNSKRLMKGDDRCVALLHPDDAEARGLADGDTVRVTSRVGAIELPVSVSDEIRAGVVSVPHGFGHHRPGIGWSHAATKPGVSVNDITDPLVVDALSGNAAFNAVPVKVEAVVAAAPEPEAVGAFD